MEQLSYFNLDKYTDEEIVKFYQESNYSSYLNELYSRYERLIKKFANKYRFVNKLFEFEDLLSEAYIGIEKATSYYKPDMCQYKTFLFTVLNQHLYSVVNGRTSKDQGNYELYKSITYLDAPIDEGGEFTLSDTLEDAAALENFNLPEKMFLCDLRKVEERALSKLSDRSRQIVEAVNGFDSAVFTYEELGEVFGVSRSRIGGIVADSYRKLRRDDELINIHNEEFPEHPYVKKINRVKIYDKNDWRYYL